MVADSPEKNFGTNSTNTLKGVAVLLLLWHHLAAYALDVGQFTALIGIYGKVCVAMFVFISGYGLQSSQRQGLRFQLFRIGRLYVNIGVMELLTVPFCIFVAGRTIEVVYGGSGYGEFILDLLCARGYNLLNPHWWYLNAIIFLYAIYPLLRKLLKINVGLPIVVAAILEMVRFCSGCGWALTFVSGMIIADQHLFERFEKRRWMWLAVLVLIGLSCAHFISMRVDIIIAVLMSYLICYWRHSAIRSGLEFLGKHSMNIYFVHYFVYGVYGKDFFQTCPFAVGMICLLLSSLAISYVIEFSKGALRINALMSRLASRLA